MKLSIVLAAAALASASAVGAQDHSTHPVVNNPQALKNAEGRQMRGAPKQVQASQGKRCRIVRQDGQDRHVCPKPASRNAPK